MTDRYNAIVVILDHDIRDDDAQGIINAIKMLQGVLDVQPHVSGASLDRMTIETRVRIDLFQAIREVLYPPASDATRRSSPAWPRTRRSPRPPTTTGGSHDPVHRIHH